jgi:UDP-2,3-diacylglucosamine pyrophosphatase LpxH
MPIYHAALRHYYDEEYTLLLLGDVEELWECFPERIIKSYRDTLSLEKKFADAGRLIRFWGNHDNLWKYPKKVNKYLKEWLNNTRVEEGLNFEIRDQEKPMGRIFLLHGHQGSFFNDRISKISRLLIIYFGRHIQNVFGFKSTLSSKKFDGKTAREKIIYQWMDEKNRSNKLKSILIVADSHMPVFASETHIVSLNKRIAKLKEKLSKSTGPQEKKKIKEVIRLKLFELDKAIANNPKAAGDRGFDKPCYFNTGACSFADGDITGIEISDREIRLVRWSGHDGTPKKKVLRREHLDKIFSKC